VDYAYKVFGPTHEFKTADIDPDQVAGWFVAKHRVEQEVVACAVWLAGKGKLMTANARLADLSQHRPALKNDIDEWLCVKHGWTRPATGLRLLATHDLKLQEDGALLLTIEAEMERLKQLDKEAKSAFAEIESLQGDDTKSKPGWRKRPPKMRLDTLLHYCERFKQAYAGTKFVESKRNMERLDKIIEAIKADIAYIDDGQHAADRKGIEKDWQGCAKAWEALLRADPLNPDWIMKTAEAHAQACAPRDRGHSCEHPTEAKRAAELYEQLIDIYPRTLAYHNYAGRSWLASGDKAKAKAQFQEVVRRTEGRGDLEENEIQNRKYAEDMLKDIK
jgi:tetratricopeptide (TPR) repeat protein